MKPKDYEREGEIEASGPYAAWKQLLDSGHPVRPGDLFETETGALQIAKYIGFEPAEWYVPEPKPGNAESVANHQLISEVPPGGIPAPEDAHVSS